MGQCSLRTSEQFNEFTSLTTIKMCEKRTPGSPQGKWRTDVSPYEADRRRRGHGHEHCSELVFVADTTGGVWIDKTLGRQRWARGCEVMVPSYGRCCSLKSVLRISKGDADTVNNPVLEVSGRLDGDSWISEGDKPFTFVWFQFSLLEWKDCKKIIWRLFPRHLSSNVLL